jgi:hypothetical protein
VNDDVALLRLETPLPVGVPTYNLATTDSGLVEEFTAVGYGVSGTPSGYTSPATFTTKRSGRNRADEVFLDDESSSQAEVYLADFDGPNDSSNVFDVGDPGFDPDVEGTLGNNIETLIAPGDSGSPSFLNEFDSGNLMLGSDGRPVLYGLNTSGSPSAPAFGSIFAGMLVARYASWIDSVMVPEPSPLIIAIVAWISSLAIAPRRRNSHNC